jgi:hypothetical protein
MTVRSLWARTTVAGVAAVVGMAGATSAGASTPGHVAGYSALPSGGPTQTVQTTLFVPTVSCLTVPPGGFQGVLAGARIDAAGAGPGAGNTVGGVSLGCSGPSALVLPNIQVHGSPIGSGLTIHPGDTVTVTVSVGPSASSVTLTDGAQSQTASGPGASPTGVDVGDITVNCSGSPQAPECSPVPKTSVTTFAGARIDGVNPAAAGGVQGDLVDSHGHVEMSSSALQEAKLTRFTVTWVQSCGVGPGRC